MANSIGNQTASLFRLEVAKILNLDLEIRCDPDSKLQIPFMTKDLLIIKIPETVLTSRSEQNVPTRYYTGHFEASV